MMRKRLLLMIVTLILLTGSLAAQDRAYHFGIFGALNLSWIKPDVEGEVYTSHGTPVGGSYGAVFEYDFTPNVGIVTGIDILHTGGGLQYRNVQDVLVNNLTVPDTGILTRHYKLQYLEVPIMLKGSTGELLGKFSFFAKFGLGNGFNIKARADDEFQPDNSPVDSKITTENKNANDYVSFFRESLIIGIGAEYSLGKAAKLQMGLTYSNGFTDILTSTNTYTPTAQEKGRASNVELNLGILF